MIAKQPSLVQRTFLDAVRHHQAGRFPEAEKAYRQVLAIDARHADSLHMLGLIGLQLGRPGIASDLIAQAIAIKSNVAAYHCNLGNARRDQGNADEAIASFKRALILDPKLAEAHNNLGCALRDRGTTKEAVTHFERALGLKPDYAQAHFNLGNALKDQGQRDDAIARYRQAITLNPRYAEAHNNLGCALRDFGKKVEATEHFTTAIALKPDYAEAHFNLGNALKDQDRLDEAVRHYEQALALQPRSAEIHNNLGNALKAQGKHDDARARFEHAVALKPNYVDAYYNAADVLLEQRKLDEAEGWYKKVLALSPDHAAAYGGLGNIWLLRGQPEQADRWFREMLRLQPLGKRMGAKLKADFSVLALNAPGAGNTPSAFLVDQVNYDTYYLALLKGIDYDPVHLRAVCDVVINLISDVDLGGAILPTALDLIERLDLPTVNHPRAILRTGREAIAERLHGIPHCKIPKTIRVPAARLAAPHVQKTLAGFTLPLLLRLCGAHGGDALEKFDNYDAIAAFAARYATSEFYVSEYIPYASQDGYFRKYRLIFVDGAIYPYHLAIVDQWKVHHFRTDMANQEWMRREEEVFVRDPCAVFNADHWEALRAIHAAIGLDYFGVDCALAPDGDLVVFEANATMLVHGETGVFAYKQPYIMRIKTAFDTMLAARAPTPRS